MNVNLRYAKPISHALIVAMIALSAVQYPAEAALVSSGSPIGPQAGAEPASRSAASASWGHSAARGGCTSGHPGQPRDTASGINPSGPALLRLAGPILLRR